MSQMAPGGVTPGSTPRVDVGQLQCGLLDQKATAPALANGLRRYAVGLAILATLAWTFVQGQDLTVSLFRSQDVPVIGISAALLLCLSARWTLGRRVPLIEVPRFAPALLVSFTLAFAAAGSWLVFGYFDLSRDEFMANFDAQVFASLRGTWPVPPEWRPFSRALMPLFMRDLPVEAGWVSSYLPGNAYLRALAEGTIGREFTGPILAAVAVLAVFRIGRILWPAAPRAALVPALLLTLSPQFLVTAMTPFAMTAHLTFNLVWLLCFLQDSRRGDAGALACGFVATGLHQIIFHPLFAAPFLAQLIIARRFGRAGMLIGGYGLICLFWLMYPQIVATLAGGGVSAVAGVGGGFSQTAGTVIALLRGFEPGHIFMMLLNLLRFAAWQHLLLLPLVICAWPAIRRPDGIVRPLLAGALLTLAAASLLMPWQGHGWGYRYLHGFLGSFALLAGYGWQQLSQAAAERRVALTLTTVATLGLILPFLMLSTRAIVAPYRAASELIEATPADVVLVDGTGVQFALVVVRNYAVVTQRPRVMDLQFLTETDLRHLCARYDVRLFDRRHAARAGIPLGITSDVSGARKVLPVIGCDKPLPL